MAKKTKKRKHVARRRPATHQRTKNPARKRRARRRKVARKTIRKSSRRRHNPIRRKAPRRRSRPRRRAPRRNIPALFSGLIEGAGFAVAERGLASRRKKKKSQRQRPTHARHSTSRRRPIRRNPQPGMAAVEIRGSRGTKLIAGPKRAVQRFAQHMKSILGSSRVTTGKLVAKS